MWKQADKLLGWATPLGLAFDHASLARALHAKENKAHCRMRRFGRCPGLEFCADCAWSEDALEGRRGA